MNLVQETMKDMLDNDIGKELLDGGVDSIKQELLEAKKEIETDTTLGVFEKKSKLLFLNIKKTLAEKTLGVNFEPGEREGEETSLPEEEKQITPEEDAKKLETPTQPENKRETEPYKNGSKLLFIDKVTENQQAFDEKVKSIAKDLNINPNRLMQVMNKESTLNPKAVNPTTRATGLIQFMPNTAKSLGTNVTALRNMSNLQQLDYVRKYYLPYKGKIKSHTDLYLATLYPAAMNKPDSFVLGSEVGAQRAAKIGRQNNMNNKQPITVKHVKKWISKNIPSEYESQFV